MITFTYKYVSLRYQNDKVFWDEMATITPLDCYGTRSSADVVALACVIEIWLLKTCLSAGRPAAESLGGGTGVRVGRGGRGRRPRVGNDERVDDLNGQRNDQGLRANRMIQEFCLSHEMQKLESELWNHAMVRTGHAAYTDRFHELARLVPHLNSGALTEEAVRNGSIKKVEKRGNVGEPRKDKNDMDWLSNHKAEITCHEKVVRISLPDGKVLRVLGEKHEEKARFLMGAKADDKKQKEIVVVRDFPKLIPGATPVAKSPYRLTPSELEELSGHLKELQDK
ncbi:hypothetical protein Tco_1395431, partial [Tanacetum coccineum]